MKYLRDPLGRPIPRLFFEDLKELDTACEELIGDFMRCRYGRFRLPIPTEALINLIAEETDELDLYSQLPEGIEGLTDFYSDRRPRVRIADDLSNARASTDCAPLWRMNSAT